MTLLTIVQAVADTTNGPRPSTVAGSTNVDAQTYLRIVNKVGTKLMKAYAWNILRKEKTFTASGNETAFASADMPSDFDRFVPETFWNRSTKRLMSGPISATEWAGLKAMAYSGPLTKFTYRGGDILAIPTVGASSTCAFEYVSNNWCQSSGGTGQSAFAADTDTGILDEELITLAATYAWSVSQNMDASGAFSDFKDYFDTLLSNEDATAGIAVAADIFGGNSRHFDGTPPGTYSFYDGLT